MDFRRGSVTQRKTNGLSGAGLIFKRVEGMTNAGKDIMEDVEINILIVINVNNLKSQEMTVETRTSC